MLGSDSWVIQQGNDLPPDTLALVTRAGNSAVELQFIQRPSAWKFQCYSSDFNSATCNDFYNNGNFRSETMTYWEYVICTNMHNIIYTYLF